eukprot:Phypoly_transcript_15989.p1 GENE.Phypoly_transcript_15989~~Phypoly_transcript_15989.p1  ORF type:complete len:260 (+),score=87.70 Phypoly_transcript_15989:98-877(+)
MTNNVQPTTTEEEIEEIVSPNVKKDEEEAKLQHGVSQMDIKDEEEKKEGKTEEKAEKVEEKEGEKEKEEGERKEKKDYAPLLSRAQEYKQEGNKLFNDKNYSEAIDQYTLAINTMDGGHAEYPQECSIFYANRAACYAALGHNEETIKDCTASIELVPTYTKALLRRATAYESTNKLQKALDDFEKLYTIDPTLKVAIDAKVRLPPLVKEQQEKEAAEAIGKLKDLGNSILGKFGLSLDNFNFQKDPATGSYSMNMKNK